MTTPSDSPGADFLSGLDANTIPTWTTAEELGHLSLQAFRQQHATSASSERSVASVRLHGAMVRQNKISVRRAAKVLAALQGTITAIAAAAQGSTGIRGKLPDLATQLTDLQLSPQLAPGLVIFHLTAPDPTDFVPDPIPGVTDVDSLVDQSARSLLSALVVAADESVPQRDLLDDLRALGPRAAQQLSSLMKAIIDEGVELDLAWTTARRERLRADVTASTATALRDIITTYRIDAEIVILRGALETISSIRDIDLRLTGTGDIVSLATDEDLRRTLNGEFFEREVIVEAEEKVEQREFSEPRRTYRALSIRLAQASDGPSPSDGS